MDVYGNLTASGTPVDIASAFGTSNQEWKLIPLGGQAYRILSNASGLAINVFGAQAADGTPIDIAAVVNGAPNQSWQLVPYDSENYKIVSVATGKVLDVYHNLSVDGTKVDIAAWSGSDNQLCNSYSFRITKSQVSNPAKCWMCTETKQRTERRSISHHLMARIIRFGE